MISNMYESKGYKLFAALPLALLLISLLFIPRIPLDSSLRGGVNIQLQTNASVNIQALTSSINSRIPQAQASVAPSPGGISVTIAANASISGAELMLLGMYGYYGNYSNAATQMAGYQHILSTQPSNSSAGAALASAQANESSALKSMGTHLAAMLGTLRPLAKGTYAYNSSDAQSMINSAKNAYSDASSNYEGSVISILHSLVPFGSYAYSEVTPTLGAYFLQQMQGIIIAAFILVAISVLFIFRSPIPSLAVVFGAGNDILVALGAMGLFGVPLGVASIGGLLMLIGYAIDTDMLAAIRVLKRSEGMATERAWAAMKTGVTMTSAAIITFSILLIVSYVTFIPTYFQIASVVLFGLVADIFTTWFGSTVLVLWYKKRKEAR